MYDEKQSVYPRFSKFDDNPIDIGFHIFSLSKIRESTIRPNDGIRKRNGFGAEYRTGKQRKRNGGSHFRSHYQKRYSKSDTNAQKNGCEQYGGFNY